MSELLDGYWYKVKLELPAGDYYLATRNVQDATGNWAAGISNVSAIPSAIDEEKLYQPQEISISINYRMEHFRDMMAHATNSLIDRSTVTVYTMTPAGTVEATRVTKIQSFSSSAQEFILICTDFNAGMDLKYPADFITEKVYPDAADDSIGKAVQAVWGRHVAEFGALRAWRVRTNVFLAGGGELYDIDAAFDSNGTEISADDWTWQYDTTDEVTYIYYNSTDDYITFNAYGRVDGSSAYVSDPVDILEEILTAFADEFSEFTLAKNAASFTTVNTFTSGRSYECSVCLDQPESFRDIIETWAQCFEADWVINDSEELEISVINFDSYSVARAFTDADILDVPGEEAHPEAIINKVQFFYNFETVGRVYQDQPTYTKASSVTDHGEHFKEVRLLFIQDDDTALDVIQRYVSRRFSTPRYLQFTVRPAAWRDGCSVGDIISVTHDNLLASGSSEYQVLRVGAADMEGRVILDCISFEPSTDLVINSWAGTGGSISPSGFTDITKNGNANYVATPDTDYIFDAFIVDGTSYGSGDAGVTDNGDGSFDYDFTNVTANHTIQATFTLNITGWEVIAKASALGRIYPTSASKQLLYDTGANQTFNLTPKNATFPPDMGGVFLKLEVIKEADYPGVWTEYDSGDPEITSLGNGQYSFTLTNITESWRLFARFTT